MNFIPRSVAFVLCLTLRVSAQPPPKPIGEWSPNRAEMYPNPWVDSEKCRTRETSGLCDYNEMLNVVERKYFSDQPELKKGNASCNDQTRIIITMAIMKKIGPHITDYRAAAKEFAEMFRTLWSLNNFTVILVASKGDNTSFLEAGAGVINLLSVNLTEKIDQDIYAKYFSTGHFVEGLNATLSEYRNALEERALAEATQKTVLLPLTTPEYEAPGGSSAVIIGVIVGAVIVAAVVIVLVIRNKKKASGRKAIEMEHKKEKEHLNDGASYEKLQVVPKASEGQNA